MGDHVQLSDGRTGIVRFLGEVDGNDNVAGIELDRFHLNGCDGTHKGVRYFECQPGRGYFVRKTKIVDVLSRKLVCNPLRYDKGFLVLF